MSKSKLLLEKYIKVAVKKQLKEQEELEQRNAKAVYLIYKFPGLKKVMEDFMSPAFARYISNVHVVSPKPTTLQIELVNGQNFQLYYSGQGNFVAKISGKKYNSSEIGEIERGSKAITNLLTLNYAAPGELESDKAKKKDNDIKNDLAMSGASGDFPGDNEPTTPTGGPADEEGNPEEPNIGNPDGTNSSTSTPEPEGGEVAPTDDEEGEQEDIEI